MIAALTNHLWQSTLFAVAAALVAFALRKNSAHVRHAVWLVASLKFLLPFSLLISLGASLPTFTTTTAATVIPDVPALSIAVGQIAEPFTDDVTRTSAPDVPRAAVNGMAIVLGAWACGFIVVALMRLRDWQRVRAAVLMSTRIDIDLAAPVPVCSSPGLLEPGVVGLFRPVLLLPAGIEGHLTPPQLEAVLAHELCHVQRRDNLTSAIHMAVEAAFWFHPLVWWIGARLIDERERACDEYVLRVCGEPQVYAESILNVCKRYVESPLACVSGVGGSDLRKRVAAILVNRVGLQLSVARKMTLAIAAVLAIALPLGAGMLARPADARSAKADAATAGQAVPKFDVVSVKPCERDAPSQSRGGGGTPITSPGRLYLQCYPLSTMIPEAYLYFADGRAHALSSVISVGVEGGPDWMKSERYLIDARTEQPAAAAVMRGPMLQAVLEDRFKLKLRRVAREMPIYELVIAKSGAKVAPYTGHDCVIRDEAVWPPVALPAGQRYCGDRTTRDGDRIIREGVLTLDELASLQALDRPLVNRTGITAPVSYRFEYSFNIADPPGDRQAAIIAALKSQLGLEVRASTGPRDFLVIDHVEPPTPNDAMPPASAKAAFAKASAGQGRSR